MTKPTHKMTRLFLCLAMLLCTMCLHAQNNAAEALQQGDAAFKRGDYQTALRKYNAAEAFDPNEAATVKAKIDATFDAIGKLQQDAQAALATADSIFQKAQKLINTFSFYDGKFALTHRDGRYDGEVLFYFIDKNADEVEKLGRWEHATQFGINGYAMVKESDVDYLIDTAGNSYRTAYRTEDLNIEVEALDLSGQKLDTIPNIVFKNTQLKLLILSNNQLMSLPTEIGQLTNLTMLDLKRNKLTSLPSEIGQLTNLTMLDLLFNQLISLPTEIWQLRKLADLDFGNNQLTSLPTEIGQLTNLTMLDFRYNKLTSLSSEIGQLKNLTTLNL